MRKIALIILTLTTLAFGDRVVREVDKNLIDGAYECDFAKVKKAVGDGANINIRDVYGGRSVFHLSAIGYDPNCNEIAYYLSSIGAVDSGYLRQMAYRHTPRPYKKVFKNKHLEITINDINLKGLSKKVVFKNLTDFDIVITKMVVYANDKQRTLTPGKLVPPHGTNSDIGIFPPYDREDVIKIVKNKTKFTREVSMRYTYQGKGYEFKFPKEGPFEFEIKHYNIQKGDPNDFFIGKYLKNRKYIHESFFREIND